MDGTLTLPHVEIPEAEFVRVQREHHETWLYFHLCVARDAGRAIARLDFHSREFRTKTTERERALVQASKHYLKLLDTGGLEPLLAQMVLAEGGLTP